MPPETFVSPGVPGQMPSIGRVVHYVPTPDERGGSSAEVFAAVVTRVHSATCVNLHVLPDMAFPFIVSSARLSPPRDDEPAPRSWLWPPRA